jgi:hypothetical protein
LPLIGLDLMHFESRCMCVRHGIHPNTSIRPVSRYVAASGSCWYRVKYICIREVGQLFTYSIIVYIMSISRIWKSNIMLFAYSNIICQLFPYSHVSSPWSWMKVKGSASANDNATADNVNAMEIHWCTIISFWLNELWSGQRERIVSEWVSDESVRCDEVWAVWVWDAAWLAWGHSRSQITESVNQRRGCGMWTRTPQNGKFGAFIDQNNPFNQASELTLLHQIDIALYAIPVHQQ